MNNVAPTATLANNGPVNEGSPATVVLLEPVRPVVDRHDGRLPLRTPTAARTAPWPTTYAGAGTTTRTSTTCTFADNGSYTVSGRIFDKDDGYNSYTTTVVVNNVAPTATLANNGPVNEGSPATISFSNQFDPSSTDTTAGFHYAFGCTNGVLPTTYAAAGSSSSTTCTFADNGSYTVSGRIFDKDDGYTSYTTTVVVNNVAPTATFNASSPINEGSSSTLSFTAPSDPSSTDTTAGFHYSFACDGLTASLASTYASAGTSSATTCPFADNGSYTVKGRILTRTAATRTTRPPSS